MPSNLPIDGHSFRRIEVLTGAPRRRRWNAAEKAAIVAESLRPGAVASTVALRHGLHRNQLYTWRRELRSAVVANAGMGLPDFVPVVAERHTCSGLRLSAAGLAIIADFGSRWVRLSGTSGSGLVILGSR